MEGVQVFGIDVLSILGSVVVGSVVVGIGARCLSIVLRAVGAETSAQQVDNIAEATDKIVQYLNPISKFDKRKIWK